MPFASCSSASAISTEDRGQQNLHRFDRVTVDMKSTTLTARSLQKWIA
jgi:hypothetical protein